MKVIVVLSLLATAFASLEPAGYRPPGSAPSAVYLPADDYHRPSASPSRTVDAPVTSYGLPAPAEYTAPFAAPVDRYLPAGGAFPGARNSVRRPETAEESVPAMYDFRYEVRDDYGNDFGHRESRDGDDTRGTYSVLLPDGRKQVVEYTADRDGFKPRISYEEPRQAYAAAAAAAAAGYSRGHPEGPY